MTSYLELAGGERAPHLPINESCTVNHLRGEGLVVEIPDGEIEIRYGRRMVVFRPDDPGGRPVCIFNIVDGCLFYMSFYWACYEIVRDRRRLGRGRVVQYQEYETRLPMRREEIPPPLVDPWTLLESERRQHQNREYRPATFESITAQPPVPVKAKVKTVPPKLEQVKTRSVRLRGK